MGIQARAPRRAALVVLGAALSATTLHATSAHAATQRMEAERLSVSSADATAIVRDRSASGGKALVFRSTGRARARTGTVAVKRVRIRLRGASCSGRPRAVVRIDGKRVMRVVARTGYVTRSATVSVPAATHRITVSYPSDYDRPSHCNRRLVVDWLKLGLRSTAVGARHPVRERAHTTKPHSTPAPSTPAPSTPAPAPAAEAIPARNPTAKPTPEPTAPSPDGKVLWAADGERSLADEWASGDASDVNGGDATSTLSSSWASTSRVRRVTSPVAQGSGAYAITVKAGDADAYTDGAQRTELGQGNSARSFPDGIDRQMYQGQDRWIALQVLIPSDFPTATWNTLVQLKGAGTGNGPLGIYFERGKLLLKKSTSQAYGSTSIQEVWVPPTATVRDRWIKLLLHVRWSTGSDGAYELLGDLGDGQGFRQLKPLTSGWTLKYGADGAPVAVGARIGIYREALGQDATAYFDGFNVATTRSAATLRAFGESL